MFPKREPESQKLEITTSFYFNSGSDIPLIYDPENVIYPFISEPDV